jgi:6-phosphogluconolactonase
MAPVEHRHADAAALAAALATRLQQIIDAAIDARGQALLALAGGRTPMPAYRLLAACALPWERVTVIATDERWVSAGHPARNDDEIAESLAAARSLRILPLVPIEAAHPPTLATATASLAGLPPFDAVLLGMGLDAHTASLFPGAAGLAAALDPAATQDACVLVPDPLPPEAPYPRVSLTAARLLRARRLLLAVNGEAKRAAWQAACAVEDPACAPISLFARQADVPFEMHWSP